MEINHKLDFIEGTFDTEKCKLICVNNTKYADVSLCFKANMFITFAKIKLHSEPTFYAAELVQNDAYALGKEIAKRWNEYRDDPLKKMEKTILDNLSNLEKGYLRYKKTIAKQTNIPYDVLTVLLKRLKEAGKVKQGAIFSEKTGLLHGSGYCLAG